MALPGWKYRRKITISGSSGAGTNYQVLLKVGESSGATGAHFHLDGKSENFPSGKNQGGDLRFTSSDGTTLLDFWVENVTGTSPNRVAYIWVEVADNLNTSKDIYIYFGNSSATNYSNGDNTFLFFDDFEGSSLSSTKWADGGVKNYVFENNGIFAFNTDPGINGSISVNPGFFTISGTGQSDVVSEEGVYSGWLGKGLRSVPTFNLQNGLRIRSRVNLASFSMGGRTYRGVKFGLLVALDKDNRVDFARLKDNSRDMISCAKEDGAARSYSDIVTGLNLSTGFRILEYRKTSSNDFSFFENDTGGSTTSGFNSTSAVVGFFAAVRNAGDTIDVRFDWIFVTKYVSPEPAFSSAGPIETLESRLITIQSSIFSKDNSIYKEQNKFVSMQINVWGREGWLYDEKNKLISIQSSFFSTDKRDRPKQLIKALKTEKPNLGGIENRP